MTTGVVAGMAAIPVIERVTPLHPVEAVALVLVVGGYAMWPDVDHPSATIAQTFGPITRAVARGFAWAFDGHRNGTHSLLFVAGSGVLAELLYLTGPIATGALLTVGMGLTLRGLGIAVPGHAGTTAALHFPAAAAGAWWLLTTGLDAWWIGPAVALGTLVHIVAGDCLTEERCPLAWPWSRKRYGLPLMDTNSYAETLYGTAVSVLGLWLLVELSGHSAEVLEWARWTATLPVASG